MLRVRDFMTRDVVTLGPEASAKEAWALCREHGIRHIPVVEDGRLVGLVSDRDLRDVSPGRGDREAATLQWVGVGDMMVRDLSTVGPLDTLENAAREIHDRKIGCLPVVDEDGLAGIITSSDMLRTLIQLVGGDGPGTWLEVEVPNEPGQLAGLTDTIRDLKVNVGGIYLGPASRETYRTIVVRLETTNPSAIVKNLEGAGYKITTVESSKPSGGPYEE